MEFPSDFCLILASQSPRRHSLLRDVGIPFIVVEAKVEEAVTGASAAVLAEANALAKVRAAVLPSGLRPGAFVLGTDTLVTIDDRTMGKPASIDEAREMLAQLSGRTHQVVSGIALQRTGAGIATACSTTDVTFSALGPRQIDAYLDSGEWRGKAGGYAIQGLAGLFVTGISGEYSNVVGLPLCLLARLFCEQGLDLLGRQWLSGYNTPAPSPGDRVRVSFRMEEAQ